MATRHDDNDGSDIFWPGYVDATTNLILNLLFLLTILIVAVFMFALELGRSTQVQSENPPVASPEQEIKVIHASTADPVKENVELKREIQRLNKLLTQQAPQKANAGGIVKTVDATSSVPRPQSGVDKALVSDFELIVKFTDDAVAFTPAEHDRLLESLKPVVENEKTSISVEVPAGFSEAKRMGFYRAMAVRNLLIEMDLPRENIDVSVVEVNHKANASLVRVRSR